MKKTQTSEILKYLENHKSGITSKEAFEKFGATRLSGIIYVLKKRGHNIVATDVETKNRYGGTSVVSRYTLVG